MHFRNFIFTFCFAFLGNSAVVCFYTPEKLKCIIFIKQGKFAKSNLNKVFCFFLLKQDGHGYLEELVRDIVHWLNISSGLKPERSLQNNGLLNTLSQHYFLFFGTLSCHPHGVKMLEKCNVFQWYVFSYKNSF